MIGHERTRRAALAVLLLAAFAFPALAQQPPPEDEWQQGRLVDIHTDSRKLSLKPYLTEEFWYNSNIALTDTNEKSDFVLVTKLGFDAEYNNPDSTVAKVGYYFRYLWYNKYDEFNEHENHFNGSIDQRLGKFTFGLFVRYDQQETYVDIQAAPIRGYDVLDIGAKGVYDFNALDGEIGFSRKSMKFDEEEDQYFDHYTARFYGNVAWHARDLGLDKTDLLAEFAYGVTRFSESYHSDSDFYEFLVGLKGRPTAKIGVNVMTGFKGENYDSDSGSGYDSDFSGWILRASATYDISDRDRLSLKLIREPFPSIASNYYLSNRVELDYGHIFSKRLKAGASIYYEKVNESGGVDDYSRFGGALRGGYDIMPWLTLDGTVEYQSKNSDIKVIELDYNVYRIILGLTLRI